MTKQNQKKKMKKIKKKKLYFENTDEIIITNTLDCDRCVKPKPKK